jgi:predicted GIY-YIG superfamily endonuclease
MVDPATDAPIYVGLTRDFHTRRQAHFSMQDSAVYQWMVASGRRPNMVSIGLFYTLKQARRTEETLIAFLPNLVNRDVEPTRRRVKYRIAA